MENVTQTTPWIDLFDFGDNFSYFNNNFTQNYSGNDTSDETVESFKYSLTDLVFVITVLGLIIVGTIIGNVFVIAAITLEKSLQVVTNYLIVSLAVTDLLVSTLVMPMGVMYQVSKKWYLSTLVCEMWISFDVLLCTASILHLVAISLDRFWAVSNIDYIRNRTATRLLSMVAVVWIVSVSISIPPLFGWRDPLNRPDITGKCVISQDRVYTIFSTVGAFYCPLFLMLFLNYRIFKAARSRIRKKNFAGRKQSDRHRVKQAPIVPRTMVTKADDTPPASSGSDSGMDGYSSVNGSCYNMDEISCAGSMYDLREVGRQLEDEQKTNGVIRPNSPIHLTPSRSVLMPPTLGIPGRKRSTCRSPISLPKYTDTDTQSPPASPNKSPTASPNNTPQTERKLKNNNERRNQKKLEKERHKRDKIELRRERKAARVLLIITGAFVCCWLPFFLLAVIVPFCAICIIPDPVFGFFLWLGYFNSLVNPVIYTIFNPSFRVAFKKILFGKYRRSNFKLPR